MVVRRVAKPKAAVTKKRKPGKKTDVAVAVEVPRSNEKYLHLRTTASPNWRDARVQEILHSPNRSQPVMRDDELTRSLYKYRVLRNHLSSMMIPERNVDERLTLEHGAIHLAHIIHQDAAPQLRTVVESRVLAGQSDAEIAVLTNNPPEVISAYHDIFFDVRTRLMAKDWIGTQVIGQVFQVGDQRSNPDLLAKYFGYFGGPMVLEAILYGVQAGNYAPTSIEGLVKWIDGNLRFKLRTQAAVLMTVYTPNRFDFMSVVGGYAQLAALEIREKDTIGEDNILTDIIAAVQSVNPIHLGDNATFTEYPMDVYANRVVEPRVADRPKLENRQLPPLLVKYTDPDHKLLLSDKNARPNTSRDTPKGD